MVSGCVYSTAESVHLTVGVSKEIGKEWPMSQWWSAWEERPCVASGWDGVLGADMARREERGIEGIARLDELLKGEGGGTDRSHCFDLGGVCVVEQLLMVVIQLTHV